ncbi:MAG: hypothetical protein ACKOZU_12950 [Planctomycetaceae bacterium]
MRARLSFSSGLVADLAASRISPATSRALTLWSDAGVVTVDFNARTVTTLGASPAVRDGTFVAAAVPPGERSALKERFFADVLPIESATVPEANAIAAEHDDFLEAVRTGRPPLVTAAAGAAALEIAARVLEALECRVLGSGRPVPAARPFVPYRRTA